MAQFNNVHDFTGSYVGSYDGRQGNIFIQVRDDRSIHINFMDVTRGSLYRGDHGPVDQNSHVLQDITLHPTSGQEDIHWSRLHLHTWNTDYLSGVGIWHGQEYGMSFSRLTLP